MHVRLRHVAKRVEREGGIGSAIEDVATDGICLSPIERRMLLSEPFTLLADGLDECADRVVEIAEMLHSWSLGHPGCRIIIASRPQSFGHVPVAAPVRYDINRFSESESTRFVSTLLRYERVPSERTEQTVERVQNALKDSRLARLGSATPLVLAFVTRLVVDGIDAGRRKFDLYQHLVRRLLDHPAHDGRREPFMEPPVRLWAFMAAGWSAVVLATSDRGQLVDQMAGSAPGTTFTERAEASSRALTLLQVRGVMQGTESAIEFVHEALGEFGAGCWLAKRMTAAERLAWIAKNGLDEQYREVMLFAAGADQTEEVVAAVLQAWEKEDASCRVPVFAAELLAETQSPSLGACNAVLPELVARPTSQARQQDAASQRAINHASEHVRLRERKVALKRR